MATMNAWVNAQSETGRYSNASDYVRDLIRRDLERQARINELQRLVDEGQASSTGTRSMAELLNAAKQAAGTDGV